MENFFVDSQGRRIPRGSGEDFDTIRSRYLAEIEDLPGFSADDDIGSWFAFAMISYEIGQYERTLRNLTWCIEECPDMENYVVCYKQICERVIATPLSEGELEYESNPLVYLFGNSPIRDTLGERLKLKRRISKDLALLGNFEVRCKWCGRYTKYVSPDIDFGWMVSENECKACHRKYPMPSFRWDSPEGRAYSYYRRSFRDDQVFYDEFERDYNPSRLG